MAKAAFVACDRRQRCSQKMTFDARQRLSKVIKCGLSRAFTHAFDQRQRRFFVQCVIQKSDDKYRFGRGVLRDTRPRILYHVTQNSQ